MSSESMEDRRGLIMMSVGAIMLVAAVGWLLFAADPMPMFIIIAGGGGVFIGAGAALRRQGR